MSPNPSPLNHVSSPVHGAPALEHRQDDMFGNLGGVSGALSFIWTWPRPAKSGLAQCRRQPGGHLAQDAEDLLAGLLPELTETKRLVRRDGLRCIGPHTRAHARRRSPSSEVAAAPGRKKTSTADLSQ